MSKINRKNKSTSFDLSDEFELELLRYAEGRENGKFSRYVKRLIIQDRDGRGAVFAAPPPQNKENETKKAMSGFL